jgi:hypothetical protein
MSAAKRDKDRVMEMDEEHMLILLEGHNHMRAEERYV